MITVYLAEISDLFEQKNFENIIKTNNLDNEIGKSTKHNIHHVGGILLRNYMLREIGIAEKNMIFDINQNGKPYLKSNPDIKFSISHSENYVMCGISDFEIGVDIEIIRPNKDNNSNLIKISERWFGNGEKKSLLKSNDIQKEFYRLWTRKESLFKLGIYAKNAPSNTYDSIISNYYFYEFQIMDNIGNNYSAAVCIMMPNSKIHSDININIKKIELNHIV